MKTNRQNKKIEADQRGQLLPRLPCKHQQHGFSIKYFARFFFCGTRCDGSLGKTFVDKNKMSLLSCCLVKIYFASLSTDFFPLL